MALDPTIILRGPELVAQNMANQYNAQANPLKIQAAQMEMNQNEQINPLKIENAKLEQGLNKIKTLTQLVASANDEGSYQSALNGAQQLGLDVSNFRNMPFQVFSKHKEQMLMSLMDARQQLDYQIKKQNADTMAAWRQSGMTAMTNPLTGETTYTRSTAQTKPPAGFRYTQSGDLEAIPGGPQDIKNVKAKAKDEQILEGANADFDRLSEAAKALLDHPGLEANFGLAGVIPNVPGGDAADALAQMRNLKSQIGFGVLQNMRNNSKTGGALGHVSNKENEMLQENLASLDKAQSPEQARENLQKIVDYAEAAKGRASAAFNAAYGGGENKPNQTTPPAFIPQNQRKLGQVYDTKNGKMKWMGNGWLPVVSAGEQ